MADIRTHNNVKVMDAPTYLVSYEDGKTGKTEVKVAVIVGDDIRFLADDSLSRPAQSWLRKDILIALGFEKEESRKPNVASTPTPVGLDDQV